MSLCSLGTLPSSPFPFPFPFPSLPTTLNPPTTCRLRLLSLSPPYSISISITAAAAANTRVCGNNNNDFMVDYLVDTLGLSRDEAISASIKVTHLNSTTNPDAIVNLFRKYGFTKQQIGQLVSSNSPSILVKRVRFLEPKLNYLIREIGFSPTDVFNLIKQVPRILTSKLDTSLVPNVNYLKEIMGGSNEKVVEAFRSSPHLIIWPGRLKTLKLNVAMLRTYGLGDEQIRKFVTRSPLVIMKKPEDLEEGIARAVSELGLSPGSPKFFYCIYTPPWYNKENMQTKVDAFKSFGWTDLDITNIFKHNPRCLTMSKEKITTGLNFLMNQLGFTSKYVASHPFLLQCSLDKRLKPRYLVLKILKENNLIENSHTLYTASLGSDSKFIDRYVERYKDKLPDLYDIFKNSTKF